MNRTLLALCVVASALSANATAQTLAPVFRSSVVLVPISAIVQDARGRAITTLKASDFEVRDNGQPRPILDFHVDQDSPLTIAVLVDTSGSMSLESKLTSARDVVNAIAGDLRPGLDAVGLFSFNAALHELHAFTDRPALLDTALTETKPFGVTSLYDAIAETARRLDARPSARRAIVVLTDCVDTSSALAPAEVSARASAIDVPVYVVATVPRIDQESYVQRAASPNARSTADVHNLALWTGGDLLWAISGDDAAAAARTILSELRHQYVLAVDSANDASWRRLDVRVRNPRLIVRSRSGYFGRDSQPAR